MLIAPMNDKMLFLNDYCIVYKNIYNETTSFIN